jgi:hypothetical protein
LPKKDLQRLIPKDSLQVESHGQSQLLFILVQVGKTLKQVAVQRRGLTSDQRPQGRDFVYYKFMCE